MILVIPYLVLDNFLVSQTITLGISVVIIFLFNFYISAVKNCKFSHRFFEIAGISLGVAALYFGIGAALNFAFGIDI